MQHTQGIQGNGDSGIFGEVLKPGPQYLMFFLGQFFIRRNQFDGQQSIKRVMKYFVEVNSNGLQRGHPSIRH